MKTAILRLSVTIRQWLTTLIICLAFLPGMAQDGAYSDADRIGSHVHKLVNQYRNTINRHRLKRISSLDAIALGHAKNVASGRVPFSHEGFQDRVKAIKEEAPFPFVAGENLYGIDNPARYVGKRALDGWIDSPPHLKNLKGDFLFTGIGVARSPDGEWIVCQIYVGKYE